MNANGADEANIDPPVPARIALNSARLAHVTRENDWWEGIPRRLDQRWKTMQALIAYYETQWGADTERFADAQYGVLSEDGVWNEMGRFYESVRDIAEASARIVAAYESAGRAQG